MVIVTELAENLLTCLYEISPPDEKDGVTLAAKALSFYKKADNSFQYGLKVSLHEDFVHRSLVAVASLVTSGVWRGVNTVHKSLVGQSLNATTEPFDTNNVAEVFSISVRI